MHDTLKKALVPEFKRFGTMLGKWHDLDFDGPVFEGIVDRVVSALQNQTQVLTCVYCGHQYPPGTPASNHESLTAHIAQCEKHPMFKLRTENEALRQALLKFDFLPCSISDIIGKELYDQIFGADE